MKVQNKYLHQLNLNGQVVDGCHFQKLPITNLIVTSDIYTVLQIAETFCSKFLCSYLYLSLLAEKRPRQKDSHRMFQTCVVIIYFDCSRCSGARRRSVRAKCIFGWRCIRAAPHITNVCRRSAERRQQGKAPARPHKSTPLHIKIGERDPARFPSGTFQEEGIGGIFWMHSPASCQNARTHKHFLELQWGPL